MKIDSYQLSLVEEFRSRHRESLTTLVFTDLADSTKLKSELGDALAGSILQKHHSIVRQLLKKFSSGREVSTSGDSFFLIFDSPSNAALFALHLHQRLRKLSADVKRPIRDRIGIHVGEVYIEKGEIEGSVQNFSGIHVDTCARVMGVCEAERTLLTRFAFDNARAHLMNCVKGLQPLAWRRHGLYEFKGVTKPLEVCEVYEKGHVQPTAPADSEKAKKFQSSSEPVIEDEEEEPGWQEKLVARRREIGLSTVAAWIAIALVSFTSVGGMLSGISYDFGYFDIAQLAVSRPVPEDGVIVYMDEESHIALGQPDNAPWDHQVHADFIERVSRGNPKAIVFDVLFTSNQPTSGRLIEACRKNGRVFVATLEKGTYGDSQIVEPFPELAGVAKHGIAEAAAAKDTVRRRYRPMSLTPTPTLAELISDTLKSGSVKSAKGRWLNYYGPPGTLPNFSYHLVKSGEIPVETFRDRIVFVGARPFIGYSGGRGTNDVARTYDEFFTPFNAKIPGVELTATATLNLLRGETLGRLAPWSEVLIYFLTSVVIAVVMSLLPPWRAVLSGLFAAVVTALLGGWAMWLTKTWFAWSMISLVEIPVLVLCNMLWMIERANRQKLKLTEALARHHKELLATELEAATQTASAAPFASEFEGKNV